MNLHLTDKIWNLLLKNAFGPLNTRTTGTADQMVIPYGSARHALSSLRGKIEETRNESSMILRLSNPQDTNTGIKILSLRFNASKHLKGISITWDADGNTFSKLKSWLDQEIQAARCHRFGYDLACHYDLDNARVELIGNPLSFGMPCEVTLSCYLGHKGKMATMFSSLGKIEHAVKAA